MNLINEVTVSGVIYPILSTRNSFPDENNSVTFSTIIDDEEINLKAKYTSELVNDLRLVCGLDAEEELKNVLIHEFKHEIFSIVNNVSIKEMFEIVEKCKNDEDLAVEAEKNKKFAEYLRNFDREPL